MLRDEGLGPFHPGVYRLQEALSLLGGAEVNQLVERVTAGRLPALRGATVVLVVMRGHAAARRTLGAPAGKQWSTMSKAEPPLELQGSLWLSVAGQSVGGRGRFALLGLIDACGSISQAARRMGMTYKNAWDAVDAMNTAAGEPLVVRSVGGRGGGGARLTARGHQLVARFEEVERAHRAFLQSLQATPGLDEDLALIRRIGMITSARNQFHGRVSALAAGAVNDEVQIEVAPGLALVATITHGSVESLGLAVGVPAYALVKASSVIVAQGDGDSISCRITVDDEVKDENSTDGVNAQTFCLVKSA